MTLSPGETLTGQDLFDALSEVSANRGFAHLWELESNEGLWCPLDIAVGPNREIPEGARYAAVTALSGAVKIDVGKIRYSGVMTPKAVEEMVKAHQGAHE